MPWKYQTGRNSVLRYKIVVRYDYGVGELQEAIKKGYGIWIPIEMYEIVARLARIHDRSASAEIRVALREYFDKAENRKELEG